MLLKESDCDLYFTLISNCTPSLGCFLIPTDFNEGNVRLKLTVVSTEGFGDQIDKEQRCVLSWLRECFCAKIIDIPSKYIVL